MVYFVAATYQYFDMVDGKLTVVVVAAVADILSWFVVVVAVPLVNVLDNAHVAVAAVVVYLQFLCVNYNVVAVDVLQQLISVHDVAAVATADCCHNVDVYYDVWQDNTIFFFAIHFCHIIKFLFQTL